MMEDKYETESPTGILTSVTQEDGKSTFKLIVNVKNAQKDDTYQNGDKSFTKVSGDYSDLLGQDVKVLVKPEKNGQDAVVYGVYATSKNTVVTALADDMDDFNKGGNNKLTINDVTYKTDTDDAKDLPVVTSPDMSRFTPADTIKKLQDNFPYLTVKFVDNTDDDKLDCAIVTPFVPAQIDSLSSSKITLSALDQTKGSGLVMAKTSPDLTDVDLYANAAEDDYVAVVNSDYTVNGNIAITKMDTVSGKVEATRASNKEFRTSGSWYTILATGKSVNPNDENDCAVVGSFVFAVDEVASAVSASNILYIDDVARKTSGVNQGVEAVVYFADGTSSTVAITKLDGDKFYENGTWDTDWDTDSEVAALKHTMFKFTKKSDSEYEIKALTRGSYDALLTPSDGTKIKDGKVGSAFRMSDEAVVFVTDGNGDTSVKTGKSVANWSGEPALNNICALTDKSNGYQYAKIACMTLTSGKIPSSSDYQYGYVTSKISEIDNDGTKYEFDVWNGTDTVTLTTESLQVNDAGTSVEKGSFIAYSMDGDLATLELSVKTVAADAISITGFDADSIAFTGVQETDFADKYVVIGVDTENTKGVEGVKLAEAKDYNGASWKNAVYFQDESNEITAVFVDTQGKMYDGSKFLFNGTSTVSNIALTLTAPVKDAAPTSATTNTDGITVTTAWKVGSGAFSGEKFAADTAYTATITVAASSGYNLNTTALTAAVNGNSVAAADITGISATGATITVTFPATAK